MFIICAYMYMQVYLVLNVRITSPNPTTHKLHFLKGELVRFHVSLGREVVP